jgi:hypothetical protein
MPQDKPTWGPDTAKALARIQTWIATGNTVTPLDLRGLDIHTLPPLPETLHHLYCGNGDLASIPSLPRALLSLNLTNCFVNFIPTLPPKLMILNVEGIPLKTICGPFPSTLLFLMLPTAPIRILTEN